MAKSTEFILEEIKIPDLRLDARYQRDLREETVDNIVKNYRKELFQPLVVGMREDGALQVVDGGHRLAAARRLGWACIPGLLFESRGTEHEAEVFEALQVQRRQLTVGQRWKARLARKEPQALAITQIVQSLGLQLSEGRKAQTSLSSFTACEKAYVRGNLRDVLVLIIQAWDYDIVGFRQNFIDSLSVSLAALQAKEYLVDMHRMSKALAKISPSKFLREMAVAKAPNAVFMRLLIDGYNQGVRGRARIEINDPLAFIASAKNITMQRAIPPQERSIRAKNATASLTPEQEAQRRAKMSATKRAARV